MKQAAMWLEAVAPRERPRGRSGAPPMRLELDVADAEVLAELRQHDDGEERDRYALAALRVGVLALRAASGHIDAGSIREAGHALVSEVRNRVRGATIISSEQIRTMLSFATQRAPVQLRSALRSPV